MSASDVLFILSAVSSLGAALGAVGITMGELFYTKAMADNKLVECEKEYIRATFWSLKWGMSLVLIASVGMIIVEYFTYSAPQHVLTANFWLIVTVAIIIICVGWAISRNLIPWWFGSAAGFTGWWTIFALTTWRDLPFSYLALFFAYAVSTFIVAGIFGYVRTLASSIVRSK